MSELVNHNKKNRVPEDLSKKSEIIRVGFWTGKRSHRAIGR